MELLEPLQDELEQNFELAQSTQNLIEKERDMLQGEAEQRIVLFSLSTDVWNSVINSGSLAGLEESAQPISNAYRKILETNNVIKKFNQYGNRIMYTPLLKHTTEKYQRKQLLDIIQEMCAELASDIMEAKDTLEQIIQTECPVCGRRFNSRTAMKSHVTQKTDPQHRAMQDRIS